jgi:uncharacterized protein
MKFGLPPAAIQKIYTVLDRYSQVDKAVLYGSRAKGSNKTGSDIDLALVGQDLTFDLLFKILNDLDDSDLPYTVDLSILHEIGDPDVVDHIKRVGKTFYKRGEPVIDDLSLHPE